MTSDPVNHPAHYTDRVPGVECIDVVEHFGFLRGNAIKYLWRAGSKGDALQDLQKAKWYIEREIGNLQLDMTADGTFCHQCGGTLALCMSGELDCCPDCTHKRRILA